MYAVIKTGGKQYRVQAGDLLVVEKLGGEPGSAVAFDEVLMLGDDAAVTVGAPIVEGAVVSGTLVETRKGVKLKVFKKIRRQGYRRTGGHRQHETVIRVTGIEGAGLSAKWDGEVDLTPLAVLNARARGLKIGPDAPVKGPKKGHVAPFVEENGAAEPEVDAAPEVIEAPKAAKPKAAPKAKAAAPVETIEAPAEVPVAEAPVEATPAADSDEA